MPVITLKTKEQEVIYSGLFKDTKECLEYAISQKEDLSHLDLSHCNLAHADLDDGVFNHTCFYGANLSGANLSEATLNHADFRNAALQNACLCFSSLKNVNFENTAFGATDIAGSLLEHCRFSSFSAFSLNFRDAEIITSCSFKAVTTNVLHISKTPLVINGLDYPVIFTDQHIIIGTEARPLLEWAALSAGNQGLHQSKDMLSFVTNHLEFLMLLDKTHRQMPTPKPANAPFLQNNHTLHKNTAL